MASFSPPCRDLVSPSGGALSSLAAFDLEFPAVPEVFLSCAARKRLKGIERAIRFGFRSPLGCSLGASPPTGAVRVAALSPAGCPPSYSKIHSNSRKSLLGLALSSSTRATRCSAWGTSAHVALPSGVAQHDACPSDYQDGLPLLVAAIHALVARIGAVESSPPAADPGLLSRIEALESREVSSPDPQAHDSRLHPIIAGDSALAASSPTSSPTGTISTASPSQEVSDRLAVLEATSEARFAAIVARIDALVPNLLEMVEVVRSGFSILLNKVESNLSSCLENHSRAIDMRFTGLESACFAMSSAASANIEL